MSLFKDTETAFSFYSNKELKSLHRIFKIMLNGRLMSFLGKFALFAVRINFPIDYFLKNNVFKHFCGGINQKNCLSSAEKLYQYKVKTALDYSVEGNVLDRDFDNCVQVIISTMELSKQSKAIKFSVFKPSAIGQHNTYKKVSQGSDLTEEEALNWQLINKRFEKLCNYANKLDLPILVDAEESWIQKSVDGLCENMMQKYNTKRTIVYNTAQMYRWDRLEALEDWKKKAKVGGYKVGVKLVRGAYMDKERIRALEKNYPSPICKTKEETDINFDKAFEFLLDNLDVFNIFVGSHNENSCLKAIELLKKKAISNNSEQVWFSQLYGMSNHISFNLAKKDYNVLKYMPFGPIKKVIPYLVRRAEENRSFQKHSNREYNLIKMEVDRRKLLKKT